MQEGQFHIQVAKLAVTLMGVTTEPSLFPQAQTTFSCYLPAEPGSTWGWLCELDPREPLQEPGVLPVMPLYMETTFCHLSPMICFL